jgi:hypothetical protein
MQTDRVREGLVKPLVMIVLISASTAYSQYYSLPTNSTYFCYYYIVPAVPLFSVLHNKRIL